MRDNACTVQNQFNRIDPNVNNAACYMHPPNYQLPVGPMSNQQLPLTDNVLRAMMAGIIATRPECITGNRWLATATNNSAPIRQNARRPHLNMRPTLQARTKNATVPPPPLPPTFSMASLASSSFSRPIDKVDDQTSYYNMNDTNEKFRLFHEIAIIEEERARLIAKHQGEQAARERMQQLELNVNSLRSLYQHRAKCARAAMLLGSYDPTSVPVDDKSDLTDVSDNP